MLGVFGNDAVTAASAAQATSARPAAAVTSRRPRRTPSTARTTRASRMSTVEAMAVADGSAKISKVRSSDGRRRAQPPRRHARRADHRVGGGRPPRGLLARSGRLDQRLEVAVAAIGARPVERLVDDRGAPAQRGDHQSRDRPPPQGAGLGVGAHVSRPPPRRDQPGDAHAEHRQARQDEHEVALHREARQEDGERQQAVLAAGQRPGHEQQQHEGQQRRRRVPDVVEGLHVERRAHERHEPGRREHEQATPAAARQRDGRHDRRHAERRP